RKSRTSASRMSEKRLALVCACARLGCCCGSITASSWIAGRANRPGDSSSVLARASKRTLRRECHLDRGALLARCKAARSPRSIEKKAAGNNQVPMLLQELKEGRRRCCSTPPGQQVLQPGKRFYILVSEVRKYFGPYVS